MNRNFHGQQVDKSASNNHPYQYADGQPLEEELFAYNNAYQYDGTLENASVYQQTYTEQPYQQLEHHQQHEQVHQALIQSYSQHDNPPAIGNEPVAEVEEAEEEEEAPVQEPKSRPREVAATRAARTRRWPKKSDAPVTYASYEEYKASLSEDELKPVEIARGLAGPRNLFAVFDDRGPEKRLIRNIKLIKARSTQDYPGFKDPKVHHLPMGISLPEICVHYPLHVWGDGLRLFICEGMDAKDIYNNLPVTARNNKQNGRPHNYLQQAMGREADSMFLEAGGKKRTIQKRKRPAADEEEVEDSGAGYDHQSSPIAAEGSLPTGQYSPDPMTMPMPTPMPAFLQMSPTGQAAYDGFPDAAPIMYQPHPVPTGYGPAQDFRSQQLADTSRAHSASDTAHRDFPYPADDLPSVLQQNGRAKKRRLVDTASLSFPTSETTEMVPSASGLGIHYGAQQPAVNNRFQQPNWTSSYPPVHPAQMHRRQHVSPDQTSQSSSALPMQNPKSAALMPQQTDDFDDHADQATPPENLFDELDRSQLARVADTDNTLLGNMNFNGGVFPAERLDQSTGLFGAEPLNGGLTGGDPSTWVELMGEGFVAAQPEEAEQASSGPLVDAGGMTTTSHQPQVDEPSATLHTDIPESTSGAGAPSTEAGHHNNAADRSITHEDIIDEFTRRGDFLD